MNDQDKGSEEVAESAIDRGASPDAPPGNGKRLRDNTKAIVVGSLLVGGVAGAAILGPLSATAASPTPSAAATAGASAGTTRGNPGGRGGRGGFGHDEAVSDTSVAAKAIGISEADLKTALASGHTVAQVAKAHNVPLQTVIDALVADGNSELQAQVANGSITQAQADAQKAAVVQRATDQANGTFGGGHP